MDLRDPDRNRMCRVVHIDVPDVRIYCRQHVFDELASPGIEPEDQIGGHSGGPDIAMLVFLGRVWGDPGCWRFPLLELSCLWIEHPHPIRVILPKPRPVLRINRDSPRSGI